MKRARRALAGSCSPSACRCWGSATACSSSIHPRGHGRARRRRRVRPHRADHPRRQSLCGRVSPETVVFMNHTDRVAQMPEGFSCDASTGHCPVAAFLLPGKGRLWRCSFTPRWRHTGRGHDSLAQLRARRPAAARARLSRRGHDRKHAARYPRAGGGGQGRGRPFRRRRFLRSLRAGGAGRFPRASSPACRRSRPCCASTRRRGVLSTYRDVMGLNVVYVDASERFLTALTGVTDPEKKRKIIGRALRARL